MLLSQSRPEMAETELRRGLEAQPEDGHIHSLLALSLIQQRRTDEAKDVLREAVRLDPASFYPHYLMGIIHLEDDKLIDARRSLEEAIRLHPFQPCCFWLMGALLVKEGKKQEAIKALDRGLAIDPEDVDCLNMRAQILTQMGRSEEAAGTIARTMRAAPENAGAHATQGWALLHTNKPKEALKHFDEALRIEPGHDYARAGMVEALKARFVVYRLVLGFFLWMARMDGRTRMALLIGAYVGYQVLRSVARANEAARPYAYVLIGLYVAFVLLTWVAVPLFNLTLRLNAHGWHALDQEDRIATDGFGVLMLTGLVLAGLAAWLGVQDLYYWAAYAGILAVLFSRIVSSLAWKRLPVMFYAGLATAASGLASLTCIAVGIPLGGLFALAFTISMLVFLFSPHTRSH
jgi:tetratricopeptide (TPR) repeat protein